MRKILAISFLLLSCSASAQDCVVLLHGLLRSDSSMATLEQALSEQGYTVVNMDYPSTEYPIEHLADTYVAQAINQCHTHTHSNTHSAINSNTHFVTHSMGGILVRDYVDRHGSAGIGRVVMLGPPNQGSEAVDKLQFLPVFGWLHGPAGLQLGTDQQSRVKQLGAVDFELGVIAGTQSINPLLSVLIPGRDDGKVSVENTKVLGMKAHKVMSVTHPMMMKNAEVIGQTVQFLATGTFAN
ncbi:alpha/beta fold hydrolase [Porticoccaceae bacterium]|nr:alpha/beta fold hydrolase [Porticoccaceae bacterium]